MIDKRERLNVAMALGYEVGMRDAVAQLSVIPFYKHAGEAFFQLRGGEVAKAIETFEAAEVELGPEGFNYALGRLKAVTGDCADALGNYDRLYGDALYGDPDSLLDRTDESSASFAALCLGVTGRADQAKAVAEAIVARTDWVDEAPRFSGRAPDFQLPRIAALCVLGEEARALQRLEAYINGGRRNLWGDSWLEIDQDLRFQALHDNSRFIELVKEVRADNARMLEAVLSGEVTLEGAS
jgi:hypothetical protein